VNWLVRNLWLIPALPLLAAGISALLKQRSRTLSASLAIGAMVLAFFFSGAGLVQTLGEASATGPLVHNFDWFVLGETTLKLGWVLDPLTASMLVMITFVGTLIFVFSVGYMAHDANFTRFFCFLSLFAAAMLGLVIANSLLLLFMCWELVGLASYLLIGFWYQKPGAAAAAKKAFITTRIGDVFFFLGILWLYSETGTLLFYDGGQGCLESSALASLLVKTTMFGMGLSTAIALLILCGAIGKSGQVPLHVWLPDAMEGPTPVSALIHAATMVAAGVFLVARVYPLMAAVPPNPPVALIEQPSALSNSPPVRAAAAAGKPVEQQEGVAAPPVGTTPRATLPPTPVAGHASAEATASAGTATRPSTALKVVTWMGAITALFAALIAVGQSDIKRILAYSTVSQLGFMFMGLGAGGVAVGMFHLLMHAFFKALLFLGSGSVIHGCHEEQDIRRMGGLRRLMPVTFATYAIGMMALSGVPLVFSGFWSKDEVLHAAALWPASKLPFLLGLGGAFLTAFYMTRQMWYVFFAPRSIEANAPDSEIRPPPSALRHHQDLPHESPPVMTVPLAILAVCTVALSLFATPVWPWFHSYLGGHGGHPGISRVVPVDTLLVMIGSAAIALGGIGLAWWFYSRQPLRHAGDPDPLERLQPRWFAVLRGKFFVDELYELSIIRWNVWSARTARWLDDIVWDGMVTAVTYAVLALSWMNRLLDEFVVDLGFDRGCAGVRFSARLLSLWQNGQVQRSLRLLGLALVLGVALFFWGFR